MSVALPRIRCDRIISVIFQAWWRMIMARRFVKKMLREYTAATVFLQRAFRGARVRKRVAVLAARMRAVTVRVQSLWRAHIATRRVWHRRMEVCKANQAATMLQVCACVLAS